MQRRFAPWPSAHSAFAERHIRPERYRQYSAKKEERMEKRESINNSVEITS